MKLGKWKLWAECGWFKGNPPCVLMLKFCEIVEDYPKGWASIMFVGIEIVKFSVGFGISK